ncbi:hypothetical protein EGT71_01490 [Atlantibacter subterranea]|uniref:YfbU family protein n=1 Tax=Atlantibacter subterraneus TaxID=255519 RepID=A0A3R9FXG5_9ENTR|nr:YfbU family protein [Atlantibacter subterranea]RSB64417.1 hypothetical protein EGK67_04290 [Atlantibacter subterranea]RSE07793.1 hypothetical protein EGT84_04495 [Atlantibacter subterranea]RSE29221.1 hypothetical protein EGT71_01490 [Atlantibacter subterranea]
MSYSQAEKLQILLLCDIHEALGIKNSFDADIIREAVSTNNTWAIEWEASSLSTEEDTPEDVTFVCDVLDMYDFLEFTYNNLTKEDKKKLFEEVKYFNGEDSVTFPGFDGNNESRHMSIAYMLKKLNRFNKQDITKNSHMPTIAIYRRMLDVFRNARNDIAPGKGIPYEALRDTLRARTHPEYR